MQQHPRSGQYSNLEFAGDDPEQQQKEVVAYPEHSYPQVVPSVDQSPQSAKEVVYTQNNLYPGGQQQYPQQFQQQPYPQNTILPAGYKDPSGGTYSVVPVGYQDPSGAGSSPTSTAAYAPFGGSPYSGTTVPAEQQAQYPEGEKGKKAATICGLPRKWFWVVLGIVLVVIIGAIIGGIAGGLAAQHSSDSSASSAGSAGDPKVPSDSGDDSSVILGNSKLTATNFTDADGVVHRTVFFQDAYDAIIALRWDSNGKTWATDNLTAMMAPTTKPLHPISGTPLACASMEKDPTYETHLWFLDPQNMIRSMAAFDPVGSPSNWQNDTMDSAQLETWEGGQLAGMWQRCWDGGDCDGYWLVAYQRPEGAIKTANSSTWGTSTVAVESKDVAANSSLAIIPRLRGAVLDGVEVISEAVSTSSTGDMRKTTFETTWDNSDQRVTELITDIPQPTTRQQFAATKWDAWNQALYLALLEDGTVQGNYFNGSQTKVLQNMAFNDGPDTNFMAIAMTPDAMFYGISNDEILEYSLDTSDPSTFTYVGTVFP